MLLGPSIVVPVKPLMGGQLKNDVKLMVHGFPTEFVPSQANWTALSVLLMIAPHI